MLSSSKYLWESVNLPGLPFSAFVSKLHRKKRIEKKNCIQISSRKIASKFNQKNPSAASASKGAKEIRRSSSGHRASKYCRAVKKISEICAGETANICMSILRCLEMRYKWIHIYHMNNILNTETHLYRNLKIYTWTGKKNIYIFITHSEKYSSEKTVTMIIIIWS